MQVWYSFSKLCSYKTIYDDVCENPVKSIEKEKLHVLGKQTTYKYGLHIYPVLLMLIEKLYKIYVSSERRGVKRGGGVNGGINGNRRRLDLGK